MGSMIHQAMEVLQNGNCIGQSKHEKVSELREHGIISKADIAKNSGIHSHKQFSNMKNTCIDFVRFAKSHLGVTQVKDLNGEHAKAFLKCKIDSGAVHGRTVETYASRLDKFGGLLTQQDGRERNWTPQINDAKSYGEKVAPQQEHINRAYTCPERVIESLPANMQPAAKLQSVYGLRISEATNIKFDQLKEANVLEYTGKGGQHFEKTLSSELYKEIQSRCINGVYHVDQDAYRSALKNATVEYEGRGSHGLRYSYTQDAFNAKIESGMSREEAKREVAEELGHHRASITEIYLGGI